MDDFAGKDAGYRKVYDAWRKMRADSFRWFSTSELAYASYAFPAP
jgi:TRAP-type mannitol/chloroaromatic compound transport system substrate-binding protein